MSKHYEDWADWAGDHPEEAEAERRAEARKMLEREVAALKAEREAMGQKTRAEMLVELQKDFSCAKIEGYSMDSCEHAEVSPSGYCENCGMPVMDWEPDDAQLLTQSGTKEPAPIPVGVVSVHVLRTGVYAAINVREDVAERIRAGHVPGMSIGGAA